MQIAPRYGDVPIITIDGAHDDQRETLVRQRRRLLAELSSLDDAQWAAPTRCDGWTTLDVVNHLITTDGFWLSSIAAGLAGTPSTVLAGFDPKATPAQLADAMRSQAPATSLAQLMDATEALCRAVEALDDDGWRTRAEAPPGHLPIRLVVHHALWDGWVHERDVLLPLGIDPVEEVDEIRASLRYSAALGPALALAAGAAGTGSLGLDVLDGAPIAVEVDDAVHVRDGAAGPGALVLEGRAVDLLEILSVRAPMPHDPPPEQRWLVAGLADVFESGTSAAAPS